MMEPDTKLDMAGGNRVQYNTEKLKEYMPTLPALSATTLRVSDRSGTLAWESE